MLWHQFKEQGKLLPNLVVIVVLCFQAAGCQNEVVCEDLTSIYLRAGFYLVSEAGQENAMTVDSLSIYGVGRSDTLIYFNQKNASKIELPIDPSRDEASFVFIFPGNATDTVSPTYTREVTLLDVECGFAMFYNLATVLHTHALIDSCVVVNKLVSGTRDEHVKIYISSAADR